MSTFSLREVHYSSESTFGDSSTTTYATRFPVLDAVPTLEQERVSDGSLQSRQNESRPGYLGVRTGELELQTYICGHNTAPTGALTESWLADLLSDALGGINTAQVGTVLNGTPSALSFPTAAGTFTVGALGRIGAKGDGGADGQAFMFTSGGTTGVPSIAAPSAPAAGAQFYPMLTVYPTETGHTSKRFQVMHSSTGAQYHMYGCQMASLALDLPIGGLPKATMKYQAAYWKRSAISFPSSATLENCNVKPITGGSVAWADVGSTTRAILSPSSIEVSFDMGLAPLMGPAANQQTYQTINGWVRTKCVPTVKITCPWETTFETLFDTDGSSTTHKQMMITLSAGNDGSALALYFPRLYPVGMRPSAVTDVNGVNYVVATFQGREGTTTTNDMTRSAFRIGLG